MDAELRRFPRRIGARIEFSSAFACHVAMEASELSLPVVALDDLISMKKAADRDQDVEVG